MRPDGPRKKSQWVLARSYWKRRNLWGGIILAGLAIVGGGKEIANHEGSVEAGVFVILIILVVAGLMMASAFERRS